MPAAIRESIFLTGACGFVGSEIAEQLMARGARVIGYDVMDPRTANPQTLAQLRRNPNFTFVRGNILDTRKLTSVLQDTKPHALVHAAAISSVDWSIKNPGLTNDINATGTQRVLEAACRTGVNRFHYLSTDEVFGHATTGVFTEESATRPRNPYAAGKLAGQATTYAYGATYGMFNTVTNAVNTYGPRQAPEKLIPRLAVRGVSGGMLPVYGDGRQVREWMHVADHASGVIYALDHGKSGENYLLGTQETHENIEIVGTIMRTLGIPDDRIQYVPDRKGSDFRYAVDSSKARRELGWNPTAEFAPSMEDTVRWYRDNEPWWSYYTKKYPDLVPEGYAPVTRHRSMRSRKKYLTQNV